MYNSLKKRRYELLNTSTWTTKLQLVKLVFLEGLTISTLGTIFGLVTSRLILFSTSFIVNQQQMLNSIEYTLITDELWLFSIALFVGLIASLIPAITTSKINIPKVLSNA